MKTVSLWFPRIQLSTSEPSSMLHRVCLYIQRSITFVPSLAFTSGGWFDLAFTISWLLSKYLPLKRDQTSLGLQLSVNCIVSIHNPFHEYS